MAESNTLSIVLDEGAVKPERANPTDAGLDLFAPTHLGRANVWPGGRLKIETGVHAAIPKGYVGLITSKSGLMANHGILTTGTIDSGYTGEICVVLFNFGHGTYEVHPGQKIAQMLILPIETPEVRVVEALPESERGDRGFGSTGMYAKEGNP